jgi:hypothetical protein
VLADFRPRTTDKTDFIVTNDLTQDDTEAAQQESSQRWKIEQEEPLAGRIMPLSFTESDDNEILPPAKGFFSSGS